LKLLHQPVKYLGLGKYDGPREVGWWSCAVYPNFEGFLRYLEVVEVNSGYKHEKPP
jgi:hypothetical protein